MEHRTFGNIRLMAVEQAELRRLALQIQVCIMRLSAALAARVAMLAAQLRCRPPQ